jgi:hypothetical protein
MRSTKFIRFTLYGVLIAAVLNDNEVLAQKIKLDDVTKIELTTSGSFTQRYYKKVEVVSENNIWNSYQTRHYSETYIKPTIKDSSRTLIKSIPAAALDQFLRCISIPDTLIKAGQFHIDTKKLSLYIDTVVPNLQPKQKAEFVRLLKSKAVLQERLQKIIDPFNFDDKTYYEIKVTTKENKKISVTAYTYSAKYRLPWTNERWKTYNPTIAELFETIGGNDKFVKTEKVALYKGLIQAIYRKYLEPGLGWETYKKDYPLASSGLSETLTPKRYLKHGSGNFTLYFSSSKLPSYVWMNFRFPETDTLHNWYATYEQMLVKAYKRGNFLFNLSKKGPDQMTIFSPGELSKPNFDIIAAQYPDIKKFDIGDILSLYRMDGYNDMGITENVSMWLILPNSNSILLTYTGKIIKNRRQQFTDIIKTRNGDQKNVCIVFDNSGKQIGGNDDPVDRF